MSLFWFLMNRFDHPREVKKEIPRITLVGLSKQKKMHHRDLKCRLQRSLQGNKGRGSSVDEQIMRRLTNHCVNYSWEKKCPRNAIIMAAGDLKKRKKELPLICKDG